MLTSSMLRVVRRVAKRHGTPTWGVLVLAASACGHPWRQCIHVTTYVPRERRVDSLL